MLVFPVRFDGNGIHSFAKGGAFDSAHPYGRTRKKGNDRCFPKSLEVKHHVKPHPAKAPGRHEGAPYRRHQPLWRFKPPAINRFHAMGEPG